MSGEHDFQAAAFKAGDERHVAMCLAQGGFARIVALGEGRVAHVNLRGEPYRHDPNGRPPKVKAALPPEPPPKAEPRVLPALTVLTSERVDIGGARYNAQTILALQHLVEAGALGVSARPLAAALKVSRSSAVFLLSQAVKDGCASKAARAPGSACEALYVVEPKGRDLLAQIRGVVTGSILSDRDVQLVGALEGRSLRPTALGKKLGVCVGTIRSGLASAKARGLVVSIRRGRSFFWRATPAGRKAMKALETSSAT